MVIQFLTQYKTIEEQQNQNLIVHAHVFIKGFQVAAILTPVFYVALAALKRKPKYLNLLKIVNLVSVPAIMGGSVYMTEVKGTDEVNKGRAFRLQRNLHQYYLEDWTAIGLGTGILLGLAAPRLGIINTTLLGASLGYYASSFILMGTRYGFVSGEVFDMTNLS